MMMEMIRDDLAALNIKPRRVLFRALADRGRRPIAVAADDRLRCARAGHVYEGRLPPPKGAPVEDWEDREQTLFRSTRFRRRRRPAAEEVGRLLHLFRLRHRLSQVQVRARLPHLIDVWGADHGGYIKRMQAAVAALSDGKAELDVKLVQLVKLLRAGEPVKMSKRSGDFVTLREVVDEVGADAVRFMMLFRKNDAHARFRPRQGDRAVARQSGLLRPIRPCPRKICCSAGACSLSRPRYQHRGAGSAPI